MITIPRPGAGLMGLARRPAAVPVLPPLEDLPPPAPKRPARGSAAHLAPANGTRKGKRRVELADAARGAPNERAAVLLACLAVASVRREVAGATPLEAVWSALGERLPSWARMEARLSEAAGRGLLRWCRVDDRTRGVVLTQRGLVEARAARRAMEAAT
jgi:hypothetical protein